MIVFIFCSCTLNESHRSSYSCVFLLQDLVILAERRKEDEGGDVFKAVDPLPPLRLLTANVHNPIKDQRKETCKRTNKRQIAKWPWAAEAANARSSRDVLTSPAQQSNTVMPTMIVIETVRHLAHLGKMQKLWQNPARANHTRGIH